MTPAGPSDDGGQQPAVEPAVEAVVGPAVVRAKRSRRAQRPGAPGTDPAPQLPSGPVEAAEDTDQAWGGAAAGKPSSGGNDDELKRNVPPHW